MTDTPILSAEEVRSFRAGTHIARGYNTSLDMIATSHEALRARVTELETALAAICEARDTLARRRAYDRARAVLAGER